MVISMFAGLKNDYVQVVVLQPRYHEKMEAMGWVKDPGLLPEQYDEPAHEESEAGKEESNHDHELAVMAMDTKDDVESFIKEHYGVDIDKRGSLDTVKDKAIGVINDSGRAD
jgi:hypothetical protein